MCCLKSLACKTFSNWALILAFIMKEDLLDNSPHLSEAVQWRIFLTFRHCGVEWWQRAYPLFTLEPLTLVTKHGLSSLTLGGILELGSGGMHCSPECFLRHPGFISPAFLPSKAVIVSRFVELPQQLGTFHWLLRRWYDLQTGMRQKAASSSLIMEHPL